MFNLRSGEVFHLSFALNVGLCCIMMSSYRMTGADMSTIDSMHAPAELHNQANESFRRSGEVSTDSVSRTYEGALADNEFSGARRGFAPGRRSLTAAQRAELAQSIERTTLPLFVGMDPSVSYDALLASALRDRC